MEIDLVFKIAAIGIIVAVLNQLLIRSGREDQAMICLLYTSGRCRGQHAVEGRAQGRQAGR